MKILIIRKVLKKFLKKVWDNILNILNTLKVIRFDYKRKKLQINNNKQDDENVDEEYDEELIETKKHGKRLKDENDVINNKALKE